MLGAQIFASTAGAKALLNIVIGHTECLKSLFSK